MEFIPVYTARNETEAEHVRSYLRRGGIDCKLQPSSSGPPLGGMFPVGGTMQQLLAYTVFVADADASEANGSRRLSAAC
jgi:hypothetical protein